MFDPPSLPEPPPGYEEFERNLYWDINTQPVPPEEFYKLMERKLTPGDDYARVGSTRYGDTWVSTVWLGVNHNWYPGSPPLIFETMVFTGDMEPQDEWTQRYTYLAQARAGHAEICSIVFKDVDIDALEVELLTGP